MQQCAEEFGPIRSTSTSTSRQRVSGWVRQKQWYIEALHRDSPSEGGVPEGSGGTGELRPFEGLGAGVLWMPFYYRGFCYRGLARTRGAWHWRRRRPVCGNSKNLAQKRSRLRRTLSFGGDGGLEGGLEGPGMASCGFSERILYHE